MTIDAEIEYDREVDGRWIAEVVQMPGVIVYGATQEEARTKALNLLQAVVREASDSHGDLASDR